MNLNQVTIPVTDIDKSIAFYSGLGLRLIVKADHYARFECPDGDSTFSLHSVDALQSTGNIWIYFECSNLDNEVKKLQQEGFVFEELPQDKSWLWREARLRDPDGHLILLYYAGANRKSPPWRIS